MTIPASVFGSVVCLLLSIVIHLLIKLVSAVSDLKTDGAVHTANYQALDSRVKNLEHKSALRSQNA